MNRHASDANDESTNYRILNSFRSDKSVYLKCSPMTGMGNSSLGLQDYRVRIRGIISISSWGEKGLVTRFNVF